MRALRFLALAILLVAGFAGTAAAQYDNTPGTYYDVKVGVVPAALPPGSLPGGLPTLGPELYVGTLIITRNYDMTYWVEYKGENSLGAKLNVNASFASGWLGIKKGPLPIGMSLESDVVIGIDGYHLLTANINGVGLVDNALQRVIAKFNGDGMSYPPMLTKFIVNPAPGNLR